MRELGSVACWWPQRELGRKLLIYRTDAAQRTWRFEAQCLVEPALLGCRAAGQAPALRELATDTDFVSSVTALASHYTAINRGWKIFLEHPRYGKESAEPSGCAD